MVRADFDRNLDDLQEELLLLGRMVEKAIVKSLDALRSGDLTMAYEVIAEDDQIDTKRFELEERCIDLIATQQPLAIDLRTLLSVLHVAVELERMGDYGEGIGKICLIIGNDLPVSLPEGVPRMAELGIGMLQRSLRAFMERDTVLANEVWNDDDEVDALYDAVCREIFVNMGQDPKNIGSATHLLWVAHDLERIADRATNIAERAIFLVTGEVNPEKAGDE